METIKILAVEKVAELARDGFTINAVTLQPVCNGFAVAAKETQNSFGRAGLVRVLEFADANNVTAIGGWFDSHSGLFYCDAVNIYDNERDAIKAGYDNGQIAIFNLNTMQEIRL